MPWHIITNGAIAAGLAALVTISLLALVVTLIEVLDDRRKP